jgi:hypothetical protein
MAMAFMLGPLISFVLLLVTAFIIRLLYKKGYYKTIGIYCLLNYMVSLTFIIFIVYAIITAQV